MPAGFIKPHGVNNHTDSEIVLVADEIDRICRSLFGISSDDSGWLMPTAIPSRFEPSSMDTTSWAVGVAFARFDIRIATGERPSPPKPDPFNPLPARSPGMLPPGDPPFQECQGILVDDPGHVDDLVQRVTAVYERANKPCPDGTNYAALSHASSFQPIIKMYSRVPKSSHLLAARHANSELLGLAIHSGPQQGHALPGSERLRSPEARP